MNDESAMFLGVQSASIAICIIKVGEVVCQIFHDSTKMKFVICRIKMF